ncbi:O-succinylbenzoic acid--CoA ligase [Hydrogenophaga crassostreae]|uniref:O-succinylbenzoic acid--CoA ligase n=1 Tax=Hydrogenophaga crassostreae TaxID=1763535 RepID=A0A167IQL7_9BURK|nr:class I adenylate-forming enzyme family protein [Hydrogenophaga crassostreae]AOW15833.1 O-succinylbenzoic acid--CoA ligase [Hydrogenophaga crassostreae]OAD43366.1 O-succinylbenzoic acid--CoA ligase [Hydrogenophaga crassostreae]
MSHWLDYPVPPMHLEALYGDRLVRCFVERPISLFAMFEASVARAPDAEAIVFDGQRWSYAQCERATRHLAVRLAAHGVQRGDRVVMLIDNRPEFIVTLLALQRLGAIAVPVGVREQRPGLEYIIGQCGATGVVVDAALVPRLPESGHGALHTSAAALSTTMARLVIGDGADEVSMANLLGAKDAGDACSAAEAAGTDTAVILYTSGTTGNPKGAMLTQLNIVHSCVHYEACMRLQASDRSALAVPASHVTGLLASIASMLKVGGAIIITPPFKAESFIATLAAERVTHTLMVPAIYNLCLLHPSFAVADLSAWRIGGYGGAPMPVATIDALSERLPRLLLLNAYGATEATSPATMMPAGQTCDHADSVGVVLPAADIRVMDEAGRELPAGETGELWIAGPMIVPGYWNNPEATAASFTAGYWHSGDLGSIDDAGYVRVFDRKKDMLNRGGFKIYSVEVENVLMAWPGMSEAAIVGRSCPVLGERVHAFVHGPGALKDDAALRAFCAARLADYKVPETVTWCDAPLPRNANGKLMKRLLREQLATMI